MGRTALIAVLACLCRAQSPQELAAARQRESILLQQEMAARAILASRNPPAISNTPRPPAPGAATLTLPADPLQLQLASVEKQAASLMRQREACQRPANLADSVRGAYAADQPAEEPAAGPSPPDGSSAARASPFEQQVMASAQQPRPVWPEPPKAEFVLPCAPLPERALLPVFERAAAAYGLAPSLLRAVAEKESSFRPCAVSPAGALGLMQLMPDTASWLGVSDPFDVEQNVHGAARFLRFLLDRFDNDLGLALGAYNAGPARVESFGGIPPIPETQDYVAAILRRLRIATPEKTR